MFCDPVGGGGNHPTTIGCQVPSRSLDKFLVTPPVAKCVDVTQPWVAIGGRCWNHSALKSEAKTPEQYNSGECRNRAKGTSPRYVLQASRVTARDGSSGGGSFFSLSSAARSESSSYFSVRSSAEASTRPGAGSGPAGLTGSLPGSVAITGSLPGGVATTGSLPGGVVSTGSLPGGVATTGSLPGGVASARGPTPARARSVCSDSSASSTSSRASFISTGTCRNVTPT